MFLGEASSHRLFAFYRLAAYTGARRGEMLYLRLSALDLDAAEVTFGGSTAVVRGQRIEGSTKGGRSRTVSLESGDVGDVAARPRSATQLGARQRHATPTSLPARQRADTERSAATATERASKARHGAKPAAPLKRKASTKGPGGQPGNDYLREVGETRAARATDEELAREIAAAVARTMLYLPGDPVAAPVAIERRPAVEVTGETPLDAARRLGGDVACLVFASARNPGGGFLTGAQAQEENLARASACTLASRRRRSSTPSTTSSLTCAIATG
jgi:Microbial-type PARG, catalytic domain